MKPSFLIPPMTPTNPPCGWRAAVVFALRCSPPTFRFEWDQVRRALSDRTRLIVIIARRNPSCTVADRDDLDALAALIAIEPIYPCSPMKSVRARTSTTPAPCVGPGASGIAGAQLCGVLIREDAACDRMASRVLRGAAAVDRNFARCTSSILSASSRRAICHCALISRHTPDAWAGCRGFFKPSGICSRDSCAARDSNPIPAAGTYFNWSIIVLLSNEMTWIFADA